MPCKLRKFLTTFAPNDNGQRLTESAAKIINVTHEYHSKILRDTANNLVEFF